MKKTRRAITTEAPPRVWLVELVGSSCIRRVAMEVAADMVRVGEDTPPRRSVTERAISAL